MGQCYTYTFGENVATASAVVIVAAAAAAAVAGTLSSIAAVIAAYGKHVLSPHVALLSGEIDEIINRFVLIQS